MQDQGKTEEYNIKRDGDKIWFWNHIKTMTIENKTKNETNHGSESYTRPKQDQDSRQSVIREGSIKSCIGSVSFHFQFLAKKQLNIWTKEHSWKSPKGN